MAAQMPVPTLAQNIETAQPLDQMPRDLAHGSVPASPIGVGKPIEQGRGGGGERYLQMDGEDVVGDSEHTRDKNKHGTSSQSPGLMPGFAVRCGELRPRDAIA